MPRYPISFNVVELQDLLSEHSDAGWQARMDKMDREQEAEEARRRSLHPTERLAEDGAKLRKEIESHDDIPPAATQETKPVLQNYVTNAEGGANLWELMKHPYIWKAIPFIVPTANGPKAYGPWAETWEEDSPPEESGTGNQEGDTADTTRRPAERLVNSIGLSLYECWDLARSNRGRRAADVARSQDARSSQETDDGSSDAGGSEEGVQEAESINKKRGGHGSSGDERSAKRRKTTDGDDAEPEVELETQGKVVASEQQRNENS